MNTILLQKILDILTEGLAHVGNFFKDLFVSDPQDGQVIGYDADAGKWKNVTLSDIAIDLTDEAGPDDVISFSDAAVMPLKSLIANINMEGGTTEVNITRTGINQWDEVWESGAYSSSGEKTADDTQIRSKNFCPCLPNTAYFKKMPASGRICWYDADKTFISRTSSAANYESISPANARYFTIYCAVTSYNDNISVNYPSTDTDYHAYNGETETVTLPASVTSGYVDVISGAGMSGDTPFTVTPVGIKSASGVNNIFADTGSVSAVYYTTTAGNIKNLVSITEDITSEVTANTTDWSSLQYKVVKNNNVVTVYLYSATTTEHGSVELFSGLPKAAYNGPVLLYDTDNSAVVNAKVDTSGYLDVTLAAGGTVKGTITYVAK